MPVIDNMMLAAPDQPGERLVQRGLRGRARARRASARSREQALELLEIFRLEQARGRVRRHALGRPAQAAGAGAGADDAAAAAAARRADGRRQPDARPRGCSSTCSGCAREDGVTFLFIEHDMEVVMSHSDRVVVMAEGRVIAEGEPQEVRADQAVIDAYLGGASASERERERRRQRQPGARAGDRRASSPATCPRSTS